MGRIKCADCGKVWQDASAYKDDPGCDKGWCRHEDGGDVMGRRSGRRGNKPPHIDVLELNRPRPANGETAEVELKIAPMVKKRKFAVHQTTSQVLSQDVNAEGQLELIVSDAININIFMRK